MRIKILASEFLPLSSARRNRFPRRPTAPSFLLHVGLIIIFLILGLLFARISAAASASATTEDFASTKQGSSLPLLPPPPRSSSSSSPSSSLSDSIQCDTNERRCYRLSNIEPAATNNLLQKKEEGDNNNSNRNQIITQPIVNSATLANRNSSSSSLYMYNGSMQSLGYFKNCTSTDNCSDSSSTNNNLINKDQNTGAESECLTSSLQSALLSASGMLLDIYFTIAVKLNIGGVSISSDAAQNKFVCYEIFTENTLDILDLERNSSSKDTRFPTQNIPLIRPSTRDCVFISANIVRVYLGLKNKVLFANQTCSVIEIKNSTLRTAGESHCEGGFVFGSIQISKERVDLRAPTAIINVR